MLNNLSTNQAYNKWSRLINAGGDIKDDSIKRSLAVVLENCQRNCDEQAYNRSHGSILLEDAATTGYGDAFGDGTYSNAKGDARVPSVVIPMVRRIFPNLIAHKLVGVQPMTGPVGFAFAYRAKYGEGYGLSGTTGNEIGHLTVDAAHTGTVQAEGTGAESTASSSSKFTIPKDVTAKVGGFTDGNPATNIGEGTPVGQVVAAGEAAGEAAATDATVAAYKSFFGETAGLIGSGAKTADAEFWGIGSDMPSASFEFLKATVEAKTRKLGVQISRETEEDMKAMQGMSATGEVSDILTYEIAQEIDRQLLGEILQAACRAGHASTWDPGKAMGIGQTDRVNSLYTTILHKSAEIARTSRRGAANWAVASPGAAALLESHIYNPLGVAGGLGNANAFGKDIDNNISVAEIGTLRNGTIKLFRDTLAKGEYIMLGFKGSNVYDSGVIYLPYIPLELQNDVNPFTMNPMLAARTRYGVTTNLFGAGEFYHVISMDSITGDVTEAANKVFIQ